jgi:hypothetical protein
MRCLFVGGCADGEWNEVAVNANGAPPATQRVAEYSFRSSLRLKHPAAPEYYRCQEYRAERLAEGKKIFFVYHFDDGQRPNSLIEQLLAGYKGRRYQDRYIDVAAQSR